MKKGFWGFGGVGLNADGFSVGGSSGVGAERG